MTAQLLSVGDTVSYQGPQEEGIGMLGTITGIRQRGGDWNSDEPLYEIRWSKEWFTDTLFWKFAALVEEEGLNVPESWD